MSTVARCTCYQELLKHVGDSFAKFRITEKDDVCSEHGEVDEILASGYYVDRQGDEWVFGDVWSAAPNNHGKIVATDDQMRLLIERDQHRDVCEGLRTCVDHPVPHVVSYLRQAGVIQAYPADRNHGDQRSSVHRQFPEAMNAARALAVGE